MTSIPSNISRVPNLLSSQLFLANLTRSNLRMLEVQTQLATGRAVNKPSDDAVRATMIGLLDERLERADQRMRNLRSADTLIAQLDASLGEASELVQEAKAIASSQIGLTSDTETRRQQAGVIDSLLRQMHQLANRSINGVHIFGGSTVGSPPVEEIWSGYRYTARGPGLRTDIGLGRDIPVTMGAPNAIGETSARVRSTVEMFPGLTPDTRLADMDGARGLGVTTGTITLSYNGAEPTEVDLTDADTIGDVVNRLTAAIRQHEDQIGQDILGPGGVTIDGRAIYIYVLPDQPDGQLVIEDAGSGVAAQDLGLAQSPFSATSPAGQNVEPRVTLRTPLDQFDGLTYPLGSISFRFHRGDTEQVRTVDLSSAETVGDLRSLIESQAPGVRVEINESGRGLNIVNEISGLALSIEEVPGTPNTATELGVRSLSAMTRIDEFNDGRGVRVVHGSTDPDTGDPDPDRDVDFVVRLGDGSGFGVNLRPEDLVTVQTVIARINEEAERAEQDGLIPPGSFEAGLTDGRNGIAFDDPLGLGPISVEKANNSPAAQDLGLLRGEYDAQSATFVAQDRAAVRVLNVFTALIDLREALLDDDSDGITIAGELVEQSIDRVASARALVGTHAARVERATHRQEDLMVLDERARSEVRDLDFAEAAVRFSLLQTQLFAGMQAAAQTQSRSLLDFLR